MPPLPRKLRSSSPLRETLAPQLGLLLGFFLVKVAAKTVGVFPLARLHMPAAATYTTLLMSTGLTFG